MADFASGAATWQTGQNIHIVFDSSYSHHYVKTWHYPQNWKYIASRIAITEGPSHGHGNIYRKFCYIWLCGF